MGRHSFYYKNQCDFKNFQVSGVKMFVCFVTKTTMSMEGLEIRHRAFLRCQNVVLCVRFHSRQASSVMWRRIGWYILEWRFTWTLCLYHQCRNNRLQAATYAFWSCSFSYRRTKQSCNRIYLKMFNTITKNLGISSLRVQIQTETSRMPIQPPRHPAKKLDVTTE